MKEVIILGNGFSGVNCDYHCETWGVNGIYRTAKKLDKLFFTDDNSEVGRWDYPDLARLLSLKPTLVFPVVYSKFKDFGLPIELYPIEDVRKRFQNTDFFSNSIAYMIALALYQEYEKIHLYGIDFDFSMREWMEEKGGVEFWIGVAVGLGYRLTDDRRHLPGKEVYIPYDTHTGKTWDNKMYGEFGHPTLE